MTFIARPTTSPEERRARGAEALRTAEATRGYLLPYHRMLCAHDAPLMEAYDRYYHELTLLERSFTYFEREVVWLVLLVAAREAYGDHHMPRAEEAGLTRAQIQDCMAVAGAAEALPAMEFSKAWSRWVDADEIGSRYGRIVEVARGSLPAAVVEIALITAHAARHSRAGMRLHLQRAFAMGATAAKIAEGLSYVMLACGGPALVNACNVWDELAREGSCPAPWHVD
ncbi:MAG: carboxymuconolactone decarboxylase family protein [Acetobacteraceae bacterium]|nr:carboxymuconolactone decarboxylase family protein [Acetobacteraceae bacterium]